MGVPSDAVTQPALLASSERPQERAMTTQHIQTLIIGAGQAGPATGYHLKRRGREFLIVDGGERVGDNWRCHWDSHPLLAGEVRRPPWMPFATRGRCRQGGGR
jgi:hypothetical protein